MDKSFLNHLKSKYQNQEQERDLITLSVRVSAEENAAIQDLADTVGCTRQDVLYELIKKYALSEWAVLRKEELEAESNIDDISVDGLNLIEEIRVIYDNYMFDTEILAASIRSPMHIINCAKIGADVITSPLPSILNLLKHPLTDSVLAQFVADSKKLG